MSTASVTIDRSSLSLSDLVIGDDGSAAIFLSPEGLGDPAMQWRFEQMPDSSSTNGREITGAALNVSSLPLEVVVSGTSAADLAANKSVLTAALSQFTYEVTVTVDGVTATWSCDPGDWAFGNVRHEMAEAFLQVCTITIPVSPVPS